MLMGLIFPAPAATSQENDLPLIADIVIEGLNRTDRAVLIHELGLDVGDSFDESRFDDIWDRLEDCGYFVFVEMDYEETAPGEITLYVTVEEERSFQIYPWVKYDLRFKYFLGLVLRDFNFRGKGETISFHGAYWYIQRYRAKWQRPRFLSLPNLEASLFGGWEKGGFVFLPTDFIYWDAGGWLRWYPVSPLYLEGRLTYNAFQQSDAMTRTPPDRGERAGSPVLLPAEWRRRWIPSLAVGLDSRNNKYYPSRGGFYRLQVSYVESRDFPSYTEFSGDLRQFFLLPWQHILGLRAYGRSVSGPTPFEDWRYWGGGATIRGYRFAQFEGEKGYLLTLEYRWPLFSIPITADGQLIGLGLHFFGDGGETWYYGASSRGPNWSFGAGAHVALATLQLCFQVAHTEAGDTRFQFYDTFTF
jgi:outer membrane protein insertion porin family